MQNKKPGLFIILFLFLMIIPYADPLDLNWEKPKTISVENNEILKTDLSIISDKEKLAVIWIQGKIGDSSIFLYLNDSKRSFTIQLTSGHEDRDPRLFKFKEKYYIIFSRKIIEKKDGKPSYVTPSILMLMESEDLKLWSEPRIIRINKKDVDNIEPFACANDNKIKIFWLTGNQSFKLLSSETENLDDFSKPLHVWEKEGLIHYPFIIKTGNGKFLLLFQFNHSIYFSLSDELETWQDPLYLMKHSSREYRPASIILPDNRILLFYNSSAYIWYTENLKPDNYDDWFKPVQLNIKEENEVFTDYMIQEIHPVLTLYNNKIFLAWASKRNGIWKIYLTEGKYN